MQGRVVLIILVALLTGCGWVARPQPFVNGGQRFECVARKWYGECQSWKSSPLVVWNTSPTGTTGWTIQTNPGPVISQGTSAATAPEGCVERFIRMCERQAKSKDKCPARAAKACALTQANQAAHPGSRCDDVDDAPGCSHWTTAGQ